MAEYLTAEDIKTIVEMGDLGPLASMGSQTLSRTLMLNYDVKSGINALPSSISITFDIYQLDGRITYGDLEMMYANFERFATILEKELKRQVKNNGYFAVMVAYMHDLAARPVGRMLIDFMAIPTPLNLAQFTADYAITKVSTLSAKLTRQRVIYRNDLLEREIATALIDNYDYKPREASKIAAAVYDAIVEFIKRDVFKDPSKLSGLNPKAAKEITKIFKIAGDPDLIARSSIDKYARAISGDADLVDNIIQILLNDIEYRYR